MRRKYFDGEALITSVIDEVKFKVTLLLDKNRADYYSEFLKENR